MTSSEQLDMVRSTARGVLSGGDTGLAQLGDLGLLALLVPEDRGGMGWCPVEATVVADEVGRSVATGIEDASSQPTTAQAATSWATVSVAAAALALSDAEDDRLAATLSGSAPSVAAAGTLALDGDRATGSLTGVDLVEGATSIVVLAAEGACHLLDLSAGEATVRPDPASIDTSRALVRVDLDGAAMRHLGTDDSIHAAARVLAAATSVGTLRGALDRLVPYLSERIAFGAPIASFQAIQHRIVDLALLEIRAGVVVDAAARALAADPGDARRLAATAHAFVMSQIAPAIDECIQLTGGIGFTWEYPLHHELRRSVADAAMFGTVRESREIVLEAAGWI